MIGKLLNVKNCASVPQKPGVYFLYNRAGSLIYIGYAARLRHRISSYYQKNGFLVAWEQQLKRNVVSFKFQTAPNMKAAHKTEHQLIAKHAPHYNHYKTGQNKRNKFTR